MITGYCLGKGKRYNMSGTKEKPSQHRSSELKVFDYNLSDASDSGRQENRGNAHKKSGGSSQKTVKKKYPGRRLRARRDGSSKAATAARETDRRSGERSTRAKDRSTR